ncbi:LytR C-terminal domain-containing protein [Patescibacteria group bacterium]
MKKKKFKQKQVSWKSKQQSKKSKQARDLFLRFITLVIFLGFLVLVFNIYLNFKKNKWDGNHQINFVVLENEVMVFSYHPEDDILNILNFSSDTFIPTASEYGEYPIGNIYKLGELEEINGGILLSQSLQELLAVPIDAYIVQTNLKNDKDSVFKQGGLFSLLWQMISGNIDTNLSNWDVIRLIFKLNSLKTGQIKQVDFSDSSLLVSEVLPDGSNISKPDFLRIDKVSVELFSDQSILEEALTVSVLNGTGKKNLAKNIARMMRNLGAELINAGDADNKQSHSTILVKSKDLQKSYTLKKLKQTLRIEKFENSDFEEDLVIILGEDFTSLP